VSTPEDRYLSRLRATAQLQLGTFGAQQVMELPATIRLKLDLRPAPLARHRGQAVKRGGKIVGVHYHPDQKSQDAKRLLRAKAHEQLAEQLQGMGIPQKGTHVILTTWCYYRTPDHRRWGQSKNSRPDKDNLEKLVMDALQGTLWEDDAQVVGGPCWKIWHRCDQVVIEAEIHPGPINLDKVT